MHTEFKSIDPFSGTLLQTFEPDTPTAIEQKIVATALAQTHWKNTPIDIRAERLAAVGNYLRSYEYTLATTITKEMGKPIHEARAEIAKCALLCDYVSQEVAATLRPVRISNIQATYAAIHYEPLGIILAIMPWNFPFWQVFRMSLHTLLAGNAVLLKHAPNVQGCAENIENVFLQAGLEPSLVTNVRIPTSEIARLIAHPTIRGVALTGSMFAGSSAAAEAGKNIKKSILELGGNDAFIVLDDADLEAASDAAIQSRFLNAGQVCISAKRFIVLTSVYDAFVARLLQKIDPWKPNDPTDASTLLGPLARPDLAEKLFNQYKRTVHQAHIILAPKFEENKVWPGIIEIKNIESPAFQEEFFGPLATIIPAKNEMEAIQLANATPYGLAASIWTQDTERALRILPHLEVGTVHVNQMVKSDPRLPIGGVKNSGYGRELGPLGALEFTNAKSVWIR